MAEEQATQEKHTAIDESTDVSTNGKEEYWLKDAKDIHNDEENAELDEKPNDVDEIDIAIINDVTIVDDDPELLSFTVRGFVIGIVSIVHTRTFLAHKRLTQFFRFCLLFLLLCIN